MATTVFRVEKKENYTIISNYHLQDKKLSNKAKGLLTIMLSLPPNWDMTLKGLVSLSSDGIDAIRAQISELEKNGYLSRTRSRDELGRLQCTEYSIHEQPVTEETENNSDASKTEYVSDEPVDSNNNTLGTKTYDDGTSANEIIQIGKSNVVQMGKSNVDQIGESYLGKTYFGKSDTINNLSNKDTYSINNLSNQSKNKNNIVSNKDKIDKDKKRAKQLLQKREDWTEIIKKNIEYDYFSDKANEDDDDELIEFVNLAVEVMVDVITSSKPITYIKGQEFPTQTVSNQMQKITSSQIEYVWNCIKHNTTGIKNIQNYVLTSLYNAFNSESLYWQQVVNHNHPEFS